MYNSKSVCCVGVEDVTCTIINSLPVAETSQVPVE